MNPTDLDAVWVALAQRLPGPGDVKMAPLGVSNRHGELFAGRDGTGRLHLLVPVPSGTAVRADRRSRGVGIERNELLVGDTPTTFVDVVCHEPALNDVFQRLASEMVVRVTELPEDSITACQEVLARWRELLDRRRTALGPEALAGLFGELHTLKRIVDQDPARRVDVWTGPTGAKHDFTTPATTVEVKTTRRREGRFAEIHGVEQLQPIGQEDLYLMFIRVEARPDGATIGDLVNLLKSAGVDGARLDQLVTQTGWESGEDDERLSVVEQEMYAVDDNFPRIIPNSFSAGRVPPGVLRLRYEVDLTGPSPTPLSYERVDQVLSKVATDQ